MEVRKRAHRRLFCMRMFEHHLREMGLVVMAKGMTALRGMMLALALWSAAGQVQALGGAGNLGADLEQFNRTCDFSLINSHVIDQHTFYGLASFYNTVAFYVVSKDRLDMLQPDQRVVLAEGEWFVAAGRFRVMAFGAPGVHLDIADQTFSCFSDVPAQLNAQLIRIDELENTIPELDRLRYAHLWTPIAYLARLVEWSLVQLHEFSGFGWGMTIVLFSFLLKILLLPVGLLTARLQRQVSAYQSQLAPILAQVKSKYDGEEAHKRIMAAHSDLGVSTFFVLKPMWGMLIQIPIWIAVFNALGEMPQLEKASFLWIDSLAYPDSIGLLPFALPLLGDTISLLPLLMTAVTVMSALLIQNTVAPPDEVRRQKRNTYLMAIGFFVLFYPFPAAMVLYWMFSNALQLVQQQIIKA